MKPSELLSTPDRWIKGQSRANKDGFWVDREDPSVCKWCLLGAVTHSGLDFDDSVSRINRAVNRLFPHRGHDADFNDHPKTTHADVLAVLREAGL
jgi:hypothetical protein